MSDTVSAALLAQLVDWGVDTIFGLPGGGINRRGAAQIDQLAGRRAQHIAQVVRRALQDGAG